jgi:hypothetical protein
MGDPIDPECCALGSVYIMAPEICDNFDKRMAVCYIPALVVSRPKRAVAE